MGAVQTRVGELLSWPGGPFALLCSEHVVVCMYVQLVELARDLDDLWAEWI